MAGICTIHIPSKFTIEYNPDVQQNPIIEYSPEEDPAYRVLIVPEQGCTLKLRNNSTYHPTNSISPGISQTLSEWDSQVRSLDHRLEHHTHTIPHPPHTSPNHQPYPIQYPRQYRQSHYSTYVEPSHPSPNGTHTYYRPYYQFGKRAYHSTYPGPVALVNPHTHHTSPYHQYHSEYIS